MQKDSDVTLPPRPRWRFHLGRPHRANQTAPASEPGTVQLAQLPMGTQGRLCAITGGAGLQGRLAALGFTHGVTLRVAQNAGHGPVIVLVRDTRLVLGRGEAAQVLVEPQAMDNAHGAE